MFAATSLAPSRCVTSMATHPNHKSTKKHNHRRPKKSTPADRRHGPAVYPPLPEAPPQYTVIGK